LVSSSYLYLDNRDRSVVPIVDYDGKAKIKVIETAESAGTVSFQEVAAYDLSAYVPTGDNLNGLLPDWQGRIWFVVKNAGIVGVLDPETGSVKTLALEGSITNTFAMDRDAAYVDTTQKMYRIGRGPDGAPQVVWEEGYRNIGSRKSGQLSAGTGTTPTVLGNGRYVAITDNDDQLHVVVYRTDAKLAPHEERIVCEVPVFKRGAGADENSLIGAGRSLIAFNCYGNELNQIWWTGKTMPSEPGIARVDIDPNGKGCRLVWENDAVSVADEAMKMSTKTGLVYVVSRKYDSGAPGYPAPGLDVYYFTAIDFRTGEVIWERQLGTGFNFDGFEVDLIGPTGTAYIPQYGGLIAVRDSR
jgi:hypothetical protein